MGGQLYEKVAGNEDSIEESGQQRAPISRSPWVKHKYLISLAVGTVVAALVAAFYLGAHSASTSSAAATTSAASVIPVAVITSSSPSQTSGILSASLASPTVEPTSIPIPFDDNDDDISLPTATISATSQAAKPIPTQTDDHDHDDHDKHVPEFEIPSDKLEIAHCGSNPTEARALGCVYDVMMQLWTPPACYDGVLTERYLANGNWTWWADPQASRKISDEDIRLGEHQVTYVSQEYHKTHCIFAWEKLVRALRNEGPIIEQLISYDHVIHCRHNALNEALKVQGAIAPTGFTRCALYETWVQALPGGKFSTTD